MIYVVVHHFRLLSFYVHKILKPYIRLTGCLTVFVGADRRLLYSEASHWSKEVFKLIFNYLYLKPQRKNQPKKNYPYQFLKKI